MLTATALVAFMAVVRLGLLPGSVFPIGYGVPIVLVAYFRSRILLWSTVAALTGITCVKLFYLHAGVPGYAAFGGATSELLVEIDMFLVAGMGHIWISLQERVEARAVELEQANAELSSREEQIARQNDQLQSQAEELERQSEELRTTNEQLERREKTLELLLSLSRALTTEMSRSEMMARICRTVGMLSDGDSISAAAILEQDGGMLRLACQHGFGDEGAREQAIPYNQSFASLVLTRGRTGYLEDLSLRPDLQFPQPVSGEPFAAVIAVPLRVSGWPIGTLEAYSRHNTGWTEQQVVLIESLAAQTSISLEAAHLFEIAQSERQRLETVLRTTPLAMVIANADCTDVRANASAAALFQIPSDVNVAEEIAHGAWRLAHDGRELSPSEFPIAVAARLNQEVQRIELEQIMLDDSRRTLLVNARPIRDAAGKSQGAVAALVDITALKELQREIDQRRREAEEASIRKTRFLAAVSHDVRTPANAISLLADLLRRTAGNPALAGEIPELAQELYASSVSLVNLLNDVLDIARFDSGRLETHFTDFSLGELMQHARDSLAPLARQKHLAYEWSVPAQPIWLRADRTKLARILGNLVGNAIKFTDQGSVRVQAEGCADGSVQIRVQDTGVGIPREHQKSIFDEFFQLRNQERDRTKGSGLGLSICKRLVDGMNATLTVDSAPGEGSTFVVTLAAGDVIPPPQTPAASEGNNRWQTQSG